jgi:hypothetical protein
MLKGSPAAAVLVVALLVLLGGCTTGTDPEGVTVSGTLSGDFIQDFIGNPVITVNKSGSNFSTGLGMTFVSNYVSGPYTLTNVPPGDYSIIVDFTTSMYRLYAIPTYTVDGGTPVNIGTSSPYGTGPDGSNHYTYTLTVPNLTIGSAVTIDIYLGNNG